MNKAISINLDILVDIWLENYKSDLYECFPNLAVIAHAQDVFYQLEIQRGNPKRVKSFDYDRLNIGLYRYSQAVDRSSVTSKDDLLSEAELVVDSEGNPVYADWDELLDESLHFDTAKAKEGGAEEFDILGISDLGFSIDNNNRSPIEFSVSMSDPNVFLSDANVEFTNIEKVTIGFFNIGRIGQSSYTVSNRIYTTPNIEIPIDELSVDTYKELVANLIDRCVLPRLSEIEKLLVKKNTTSIKGLRDDPQLKMELIDSNLLSTDEFDWIELKPFEYHDGLESQFRSLEGKLSTKSLILLRMLGKRIQDRVICQ